MPGIGSLIREIDVNISEIWETNIHILSVLTLKCRNEIIMTSFNWFDYLINRNLG